MGPKKLESIFLESNISGNSCDDMLKYLEKGNLKPKEKCTSRKILPTRIFASLFKEFKKEFRCAHHLWFKKVKTSGRQIVGELRFFIIMVLYYELILHNFSCPNFLLLWVNLLRPLLMGDMQKLAPNSGMFW